MFSFESRISCVFSLFVVFVSCLKMQLHIAQRQRVHFFQPRILFFIHGRARTLAPAFYICKLTITQHMIIQKAAASKCFPQHYPLILIRFYPESVCPVHRFSLAFYISSDDFCCHSSCCQQTETSAPERIHFTHNSSSLATIDWTHFLCFYFITSSFREQVFLISFRSFSLFHSRMV